MSLARRTYLWLFATWLVATTVAPTELAMVIGFAALACGLAATGFRISRMGALALAGIPVVTLIFMVMAHSLERGVFRDAFYVSRILLAVALGSITVRAWDAGLAPRLLTAMACSILVVFGVRAAFEDFSLDPIWLRDHIHPGAWVFVALPWLWGMFGISSKRGGIAVGVFWALGFATLSRLWTLVAVYVAGRFTRWTRARVAVAGSLAVAATLGFLYLSPGQSSNNASDGYARSYSEKIVDVWDELAPRFYFQESEINLNWRGYEAYLLIQAIQTDWQQGNFFGRGPGAELDLYFNKRVDRGSEEYQSTGAWFHDGLLAATFKLGVFGALFVMSWWAAVSIAWWRCCRIALRSNVIDRLLGPAFFGLGIVFLGLPFDAIDAPAISLLIGWASEIRRRSHADRSAPVH